MKAYTLRLEDGLMSSLKTLSRRTHRSMREIVAEALKKAVAGDDIAEEDARYRRSLAQAAKMLSKIDEQRIVASLREDRAR